MALLRKLLSATRRQRSRARRRLSQHRCRIPDFMWASLVTAALRVVGSWVDFRKTKIVAANTEKMVQAHEAANIEVNRGEIRELIHTAHSAPDPKKRTAPFAQT